MSESSSEGSSKPIPQPPRDAKLPPIIHPVQGMDRESLQIQKKVRRSYSWWLLSSIAGCLFIGMILGILSTVLSPSKQSVVFVAQLDHGSVNSSIFLKEGQAQLPRYVRLGMYGYCSSEDNKFKSHTCTKYEKNTNWDNVTEIYSSLLNTAVENLVMPPLLNKTNKTIISTSGFSSDGQIVTSPVMHGISLLVAILALGAMGYRSTATVHIWLTFGALALLAMSFMMSGFATLGDTIGFYKQISKGLHPYGVNVTLGWGFRALFYVLNVLDFATAVLMVLAICVFLS